MITIGLAQGDALGGGFESLLSFNVGVEIGQLAVVGALAPFLWLLARGRLRLRECLQHFWELLPVEFRLQNEERV